MDNAGSRLGEAVRRLREATGVGPDRFAREHGWNRDVWRRIEAGEANPSLATLVRIAAALGTTVSALTEGVDPHAA